MRPAWFDGARRSSAGGHRGLWDNPEEGLWDSPDESIPTEEGGTVSLRVLVESIRKKRSLKLWEFFFLCVSFEAGGVIVSRAVDPLAHGVTRKGV